MEREIFNYKVEKKDERQKLRKIINYYLLIIYFSLLFIDPRNGKCDKAKRRLQS